MGKPDLTIVNKFIKLGKFWAEITHKMPFNSDLVNGSIQLVGFLLEIGTPDESAIAITMQLNQAHWLQPAHRRIDPNVPVIKHMLMRHWEYLIIHKI